MNGIFIEDKTIIDTNSVENIIPQIPFHFVKSTTTEKFPMYGHCLIPRPDNDNLFDENTEIYPVSTFFEYFKSYVDLFCLKHKISYTNIIRANINSTFHIPNYFCGDPHIDFSKKHIVLLMYLSDISLNSKTLIFSKCQNFDKKNTFIDISKVNPFDEMNILKEISPEFGKMVVFDGKYYHSNVHPSPGENRIVCVFNLLT